MNSSQQLLGQIQGLGSGICGTLLVLNTIGLASIHLMIICLIALAFGIVAGIFKAATANNSHS